MKKLFVLLMVAVFAVSAPASTVKKTTKPAATKKAAIVKKKPPVSNVRPEIKKPNKVERKAKITKKKSSVNRR